MIWDTVIELAGKALDRAFPDPIEKQKAQVALLQLQSTENMAYLKANVDTAIEQIKVNAVEAASQDPFVRRGRPAVIWMGVAGLGYQAVLQPLLGWASGIWSFPPPPPADTSTLSTLLFSLLGVAGMRSYDKKTAAITDK